MFRRGWNTTGRGAGLCLALLLLCAVPAAAAAQEPGNPGDSQAPAVLVPGSTSSWVLGTTGDSPAPGGLTLQLSADGALASAAAPDGLLTIAVNACPGQWSAGRCAEGASNVIPPTPLDSPGGTLRSRGGLPAGAELLAEVTLSPAAGNAVQGLSFRLAARDNAGEARLPAAVGVPAEIEVPDGGRLPGGGSPDTGVRLGGFALLGAAAAAAGLAAAAWARRQTESGPVRRPTSGEAGA
jgi:hypothetical protein